jgi:hypothetical protein
VALQLPEAVEQDHHGRPSFRVGGRIFATLWTADRLNVMLDPHDIEGAALERPAVCEPFWWGRRLAALQVHVELADTEFVSRLLRAAWARKAPRRLSEA